MQLSIGFFIIEYSRCGCLFCLFYLFFFLNIRKYSSEFHSCFSFAIIFFIVFCFYIYFYFYLKATIYVWCIQYLWRAIVFLKPYQPVTLTRLVFQSLMRKFSNLIYSFQGIYFKESCLAVLDIFVMSFSNFILFCNFIIASILSFSFFKDLMSDQGQPKSYKLSSC